MEKVRLSNHEKIESFLKGNENAVFGQPGFSGYFMPGVFFTIFWFAVILVLSYTGFKKMIFCVSKKEIETQTPVDVDIEKPGFYEWQVEGQLLNDLLFYALSKKPADFFYLGRPDRLPCDIDTKHFLDFLYKLLNVPLEKREEITATYRTREFAGKKLGKLNDDEKCRLYLTVISMKRFNVYLLDNITWYLYYDFAVNLKKQLDEYIRSGSAVLYLNTGGYMKMRTKPKSGDIVRLFRRSHQWQKAVEESAQEKQEDIDDE